MRHSISGWGGELYRGGVGGMVPRINPHTAGLERRSDTIQSDLP